MIDTKTVGWLLLIIVGSFAIVIIMNNAVLLQGLFDPKVDNDKIFAILGHSYDTIVGAFIGLVTGLVLGNREKP
jgi:hypothetical protein